jgi:hypothetical protein
MYTVHLVEPKGREVVGIYDGYGQIVTIEYLREFTEKIKKATTMSVPHMNGPRTLNTAELRSLKQKAKGPHGPTTLPVVMAAMNSLLKAEDDDPAIYGVKNIPKKNYASVGDLRHYACWKVAGEPGFEHGSATAHDQGYFANWKGIKEPASRVDIARLIKKAAELPVEGKG